MRTPDGTGSAIRTWIASWLLLSACSGGAATADLPLTGRGVAISRVGRASLPTGRSIRAREGDWLVESDRLRLVVAARRGGRRVARGSVVDAVAADWAEDELEELSPVLFVRGAEVPLVVERVVAVARDGRPALRIEQRWRRGGLLVRTEIRPVPREPYAVIRTRVVNAGRDPVGRVRIGDRTRWRDDPTFLPGHGWVQEATRSFVPWLGRKGRTVSYALAFSGARAEVDCRFEPHGPLDQVALGPRVDLAPGESALHRRLLVVSPGGLAEVAEVAWLAGGRRVGHVRGSVEPRPSRATVRASLSGRGPTLAVDVDGEGRFEMPLPPGTYRVEVRAPGGTDEQIVNVAPPARPAPVELRPPTPGRLRYLVTDPDGRPVPARIVVRGVQPSRDPSFGPDFRADGAGNVINTRTGEGEAEIPPGRFRATVTHGIEFGLSEHEFTVAEGEGSTLRATLGREVRTDGWIASDFHLHADPSPDSRVSLRDRITSLLAEGIEFAVATDHNTVTDYGPILEGEGARELLASSPGVEVTTFEPQRGHFNVFPYPTDGPPPQFVDVTPRDLFPQIRETAPGCVIQVNHPRMGWDIGYFVLGGLDPRSATWEMPWAGFGFDTLEVHSGMDLKNPEVVERNLADWFDLLNSGIRVTATGNSDSHRLVGQWAGYPRTYVRVRDDRPVSVSAEEVAASLREGHAFVTTGPIVEARIDGAGPGDLVAARGGGARLEVEVRAAPWIDVDVIEVVRNGEIVARERIEPAPRSAIRARVSKDLEVRADEWVVVVVRGETTLDVVLPHTPALPMAFTNPIYVDGNGDGRFRAPFEPGTPDGGLSAPSGDRSGRGEEVGSEAPNPPRAE